MAALNPRGFRTPAKRDLGGGKKSPRSLRKAQAREQLRDAIIHEQCAEYLRHAGKPWARPRSSFGSLS